MPTPPETFATARLRARPPTIDDAPEIFRVYASDPTVTRYLSWRPYTDVEPVRAFLAGVAANWEKRRGHLSWLLYSQETHRLVGSIGVSVDGAHALFGYALARPCWGHGYAAEALRHLVDWALAQPEIFRAWAFCDADHTPSLRVMEKAGMAREGVLRRWHVFPNLGPEPRDCIVAARVK